MNATCDTNNEFMKLSCEKQNSIGAFGSNFASITIGLVEGMTHRPGVTPLRAQGLWFVGIAIVSLRAGHRRPQGIRKNRLQYCKY